MSRRAAKSQPTPTKATGAAPAEARTRGRELPNTGMNLLGESSLGLGLLLLGVLLVLSARQRDHR